MPCCCKPAEIPSETDCERAFYSSPLFLLTVQLCKREGTEYLTSRVFLRPSLTSAVIGTRLHELLLSRMDAGQLGAHHEQEHRDTGALCIMNLLVGRSVAQLSDYMTGCGREAGVVDGRGVARAPGSVAGAAPGPVAESSEAHVGANDSVGPGDAFAYDLILCRIYNFVTECLSGSERAEVEALMSCRTAAAGAAIGLDASDRVHVSDSGSQPTVNSSKRPARPFEFKGLAIRALKHLLHWLVRQEEQHQNTSAVVGGCDDCASGAADASRRDLAAAAACGGSHCYCVSGASPGSPQSGSVHDAEFEIVWSSSPQPTAAAAAPTTVTPSAVARAAPRLSNDSVMLIESQGSGRRAEDTPGSASRLASYYSRRDTLAATDVWPAHRKEFERDSSETILLWTTVGKVLQQTKTR